MFVLGTAVDVLLVAKTLEQMREVMKSLTSVPATSAELAQAQAELSAQRTKDLATSEGIARVWLDNDTFALTENVISPDAVTVVDLQRVASRLFKDTSVAAVVIGDAKQLQAALQPSIKIEMMGEVEARPAKTETKPAFTIPIKKPE
jgi:predicted Zn-dependent peptidase